jgi:hypothetical protein
MGCWSGTTTVVTAGDLGSFAPADIYSLEQAIPARSAQDQKPSATGAAIRQDQAIRRFRAGDPVSTEHCFDQETLIVGGLNGTVFDYRAWEDTVMVSTITTGSKILAMGDFRYFVIALGLRRATRSMLSFAVPPDTSAITSAP